jgi:hypothetical protein
MIKFSIKNIVIFIFYILSIFILIPISIIIGEIVKMNLCKTVLSKWSYCSYIDSIGDIPEKDLIFFSFPIFILLLVVFLKLK